MAEVVKIDFHGVPGFHGDVLQFKIGLPGKVDNPVEGIILIKKIARGGRLGDYHDTNLGPAIIERSPIWIATVPRISASVRTHISLNEKMKFFVDGEVKNRRRIFWIRAQILLEIGRAIVNAHERILQLLAVADIAGDSARSLKRHIVRL
jgi:hypothetical protein